MSASSTVMYDFGVHVKVDARGSTEQAKRIFEGGLYCKATGTWPVHLIVHH